MSKYEVGLVRDTLKLMDLISLQAEPKNGASYAGMGDIWTLPTPNLLLLSLLLSSSPPVGIP
jgi:hypothetical protein